MFVLAHSSLGFHDSTCLEGQVHSILQTLWCSEDNNHCTVNTSKEKVNTAVMAVNIFSHIVPTHNHKISECKDTTYIGHFSCSNRRTAWHTPRRVENVLQNITKMCSVCVSCRQKKWSLSVHVAVITWHAPLELLGRINRTWRTKRATKSGSRTTSIDRSDLPCDVSRDPIIDMQYAPGDRFSKVSGF